MGARAQRGGLEVDSDGTEVRKRTRTDVCGVPRSFAIVFGIALAVLIALFVLIGVASSGGGGGDGEVEAEADAACDAWVRNSLEDLADDFELADDEPGHRVDHQFAYSGVNGPAFWGCIKPEWELCRTGTAQSPIDIVTAAAAAAGGLLRRTARTSVFAKSSSDPVHYACVEGCGAVVNAFGDLPLKQIHFHTLSEHAIDGELSPLEMHAVHCDGECAPGVDNFAVFGILFGRPAGAVPGTAAALDALAALIGGGGAGRFEVDWSELVRVDAGATYSYTGSLTTPPCTERVSWLVQGAVVPLAAETLELLGTNREATNRPLQPLGDGRGVASFGA